jgi:hypothetical protein
MHGQSREESIDDLVDDGLYISILVVTRTLYSSVGSNDLERDEKGTGKVILYILKYPSGEDYPSHRLENINIFFLIYLTSAFHFLSFSRNIP